MMMKKLSLLLTTALITILSFAQPSITQSVKGKLVDSDNNPLAGATISVKDNSISTVSSNEGLFLLSGLKSGKQSILISYVGLIAEEIKTEPKPGETLNLGIIELNNNSKVLQTVEITGRKEKTYKNSISFIGSKTATA